jgi:hypothetical protein
MGRHSKIEATYLNILDDPNASQSDKLQAATMLDKAKERRKHRRTHTKGKARLGMVSTERLSKAQAALPTSFQGTDFASEAWPEWEADKKALWLSIWKLEQ